MATLYVTEYASAGHKTGGTVPVAHCAPVANNNVTIGVGSAQSNAFSANTTLIRVHADAICSILIGVNPSAATSDARMAANQTEYYSVQSGLKIAVISNT